MNRESVGAALCLISSDTFWFLLPSAAGAREDFTGHKEKLLKSSSDAFTACILIRILEFRITLR